MFSSVNTSAFLLLALERGKCNTTWCLITPRTSLAITGTERTTHSTNREQGMPGYIVKQILIGPEGKKRLLAFANQPLENTEASQCQY
jgi:hypothetical protein